MSAPAASTPAAAPRARRLLVPALVLATAFAAFASWVGLGRAVYLAFVLGAAWLLTWRVLPGIAVFVGRRLGLRMKFTPVVAKRVARFRRIRRGYWSFRAVTTAFVLSLFLELIVSGKPLVLHYDGRTAFPAVAEWAGGFLPFLGLSSYTPARDFGLAEEGPLDVAAFRQYAERPDDLRAKAKEVAQRLEADRSSWETRNPPPGEGASETRRRRWQEDFERKQRVWAKQEAQAVELDRSAAVFERGDAWCLMPLYPYGLEVRTDLSGTFPKGPAAEMGIPLGTDFSGRDVVPILLYGFRISLAFALVVSLFGYLIGIVVGAIQGFYGGWTDILSQRVVEIWSAIPFLFVIMIIASMVTPTFLLLVGLLVLLRAWIGITYYVRGEYLREKAKDYVQAAVGSGVRDRRIVLGHILPNALVPIVTFAPFGIVAYIGSLVSLDYLGFGLPPGTPSWGSLLRQGLENVRFYPHLTVVPASALAVTLFAVVMVGEAVREAFDPKVFSRLR